MICLRRRNKVQRPEAIEEGISLDPPDLLVKLSDLIPDAPWKFLVRGPVHPLAVPHDLISSLTRSLFEGLCTFPPSSYFQTKDRRVYLVANDAGSAGPFDQGQATMAAIYRLAMRKDASRLYDIRRRSILELAPPAMPAAEAQAWASKLTLAGMERKLRELEVWVAELGGVVGGWGAIRGDMLEGLYAAPECAGQGVG